MQIAVKIDRIQLNSDTFSGFTYLTSWDNLLIYKMTHQVVPKPSIQGLCYSHNGPDLRVREQPDVSPSIIILICSYLSGRLLPAGLLRPLEQSRGLAAERQGEGGRQRRPQLGHPRVEAAAGQAAARGRPGAHQGAHQGKSRGIHFP